MGVSTKPPISQLFIIRLYQTWHQNNAQTFYSYLVVEYEKYLIWLFMTFNENIRN